MLTLAFYVSINKFYQTRYFCHRSHYNIWHQNVCQLWNGNTVSQVLGCHSIKAQCLFFKLKLLGCFVFSIVTSWGSLVSGHCKTSLVCWEIIKVLWCLHLLLLSQMSQWLMARHLFFCNVLDFVACLRADNVATAKCEMTDK